jgi:CubicO group peptidase (beta-lactamase class C family)
MREMYDGALTPDLAVGTFRNIDRLSATRVVRCGGTPFPLLPAAKTLPPLRFESRGRTWDLFDYWAVNRVAGLLVLKEGRIAHECYQYGNGPDTRWMSMSVAKSFTSTLIGAALEQGYIGSIDEPVTRYVPELSGSVYADASIKHVLMMASGARWNETYTDPASDRRRFLEAQLAQAPGATLEVMKKLARAAPPGQRHNYSTGETQIAGAVLRGAIGRPLAEYLSERIWQRYGMEADARWWLESPDGMEIGGSGISATLRDYGRFGLFFLEGGIAGGERILPEGWTLEATTPKVLADGRPLNYGYLWWPAWPSEAIPKPRRGAFAAMGIFGQFIYLDPAERVVIVAWGARSKPQGMNLIDDIDFFSAVVAALQ